MVAIHIVMLIEKPADLLKYFGTARTIGGDRAIFKIAGNKHRLVAQVDFDNDVVQIRFLGTPDEYLRIDVFKV